MTSVEFAYWLQGFFELSEATNLTEKQVDLIKRHLALVFFHEIDPKYSPDQSVQEDMNSIHGQLHIQNHNNSQFVMRC